MVKKFPLSDHGHGNLHAMCVVKAKNHSLTDLRERKKINTGTCKLFTSSGSVHTVKNCEKLTILPEVTGKVNKGN